MKMKKRNEGHIQNTSSHLLIRLNSLRACFIKWYENKDNTKKC